MDVPQIIYSTDTHTVFQVEPVSAVTGEPLSLVGAVACTARFALATGGPGGPGTSGTGVGTISATANYKPSVADLAQAPGIYDVQVSVQFADGSNWPLVPFQIDLRAAL